MNKTQKAVKEIRAIVLETFPKLNTVRLTDDDHLVKDDFIDSVEVVELIVVLNKTYGGGFRTRDVTKFGLDTINGLADILVNNAMEKLK